MDINFYRVIAWLRRYAKPDFMGDHKHRLARYFLKSFNSRKIHEISKVGSVSEGEAVLKGRSSAANWRKKTENFACDREKTLIVKNRRSIFDSES